MNKYIFFNLFFYIQQIFWNLEFKCNVKKRILNEFYIYLGPVLEIN